VPIIEPGNPDLASLKGIHLWHAGLSTCSQRVRILLAELGLDFESHIVNLQLGEQAAPEYQAINPNGVIPSLVHDGVLIIESIDIIAYLDSTLGDSQMQPEEQKNDIAALLAHADAAQAALKVCSYEFLFSGGPEMSDEDFDKYQQGQGSGFLRQFHRDYRAGFKRDRIHDAVNAVRDDFQVLEDRLSDGRNWLAGEAFTVADISWTPNFHRMDLLRWPIDQTPYLSAWFRRISARPSYQSALADWEPQPFLELVLPVLDARRARGDGVESYGVLAAWNLNISIV